MATTQQNEQQPALSAEQKAILKKVAKLMPEAKVFEPREEGNYYGPIVYADKKHVVQQVGDNTVVAHPRQDMRQTADFSNDLDDARVGFTQGEVVTVAWGHLEGLGKAAPTIEPADPERWKERAGRIPASPEHTALAREALGEKFGVYNPPSMESGLSPRYEGVVAAVTDTHLIQRINSRTAIVHDVGPEVAKQYAAGQELSVSYDNGKLKAVDAIERPKSQERVAKRQNDRAADSRSRDPEDAARAKSWAIARAIVNQTHGTEDKKVAMYSARRLDAETGKYQGPIVAVTDHHVVQRVGKNNKFVAHTREDLSGVEPRPGQQVLVAYDNGRARIRETRPKEHTQQRPAPERPAPSRNQGMSR